MYAYIEMYSFVCSIVISFSFSVGLHRDLGDTVDERLRLFEQRLSAMDSRYSQAPHAFFLGRKVEGVGEFHPQNGWLPFGLM